jgi:hypothetical protein
MESGGVEGTWAAEGGSCCKAGLDGGFPPNLIFIFKPPLACIDYLSRIPNMSTRAVGGG